MRPELDDYGVERLHCIGPFAPAERGSETPGRPVREGPMGALVARGRHPNAATSMPIGAPGAKDRKCCCRTTSMLTTIYRVCS